MKSTTLAFVLLGCTSLVFAKPPERPTGYVTDQAGVLDSSTRQQLDALLADLDQKTSAQVAVVTLTSLDGNQIDDVANRLFEAWGIGKKGKDNGVLFLIAPQDKKVRIEVGYGLEGVLPDAKTGRLLDDYVMPAFRQGNMAAGIVNGTHAIAQILAGQPLPPPTHVDNSFGVFMVILIFIFIFVVIVKLVSRGPRGPSGGGGGTSTGGGSGWSGGSSSGGSSGGFGGGSSGGGGSSRGW